MTTPPNPMQAMPLEGYDETQGAIPVYFPAAAGNHLIVSGSGKLMGWSVHNTDAGAAHNIAIKDGTDANGYTIGISRMATSISDTEHCGAVGVAYQSGLYVVDASGLVEGVLWFVPC